MCLRCCCVWHKRQSALGEACCRGGWVDGVWHQAARGSWGPGLPGRGEAGVSYRSWPEDRWVGSRVLLPYRGQCYLLSSPGDLQTSEAGDVSVTWHAGTWTMGAGYLLSWKPCQSHSLSHWEVPVLSASLFQRLDSVVMVCASRCIVRPAFQQLLKQEKQSLAVNVTLYSQGLDTNLHLQYFSVICMWVLGVPAVARGVGVLGIYDFKVIKESTQDKYSLVCFSSPGFCLVSLENLLHFWTYRWRNSSSSCLTQGEGKECLYFSRNRAVTTCYTLNFACWWSLKYISILGVTVSKVLNNACSALEACLGSYPLYLVLNPSHPKFGRDK